MAKPVDLTEVWRSRNRGRSERHEYTDGFDANRLLGRPGQLSFWQFCAVRGSPGSKKLTLEQLLPQIKRATANCLLR